VSPISDLLEDVDRQWKPTAERRVELHIIGSSALMLQTAYERATKDGDVLETQSIDTPTRSQLLALAGEKTVLARKHRIYVETVPRGLPFLPQQPVWHPRSEINDRLRHFDVFVLDVVDVVVSKLFRFSANDRSDIDVMITRELVPHDRLLARFNSAVDRFSHDARSNQLPATVKNLNAVERDSFGVAESEITLPDWIDED
jgi:hypothetical protein